MAEARTRRILVFGWGAAAERVLKEVAVCQPVPGALRVLCVSHLSQASDCDLRAVCEQLGFECVLTDAAGEVLEVSTAFRPQLIISASYRKLIRPEVLALCPDCVNFHPSLLPKHRGCWSGFWAIFEGDTETGVTCHRMVEKFDEGKVLHVERTAIGPEDTSESIYRKLLPVTAACARRVLQLYLTSGLPEGQPQAGEASYHYRRLPYDGLIQPEWSDEQVERFLRAMHFPPFDGAAMVVPGEAGEQRVLVESLEHYRRLKSGSGGENAAA